MTTTIVEEDEDKRVIAFLTQIQTIRGKKPEGTKGVRDVAKYCEQGNVVKIESLGWTVEVGVTTILFRKFWYAKRHPARNDKNPVLAFFSNEFEWVDFIETEYYRDLLVATTEAQMKGVADDDEAN